MKVDMENGYWGIVHSVQKFLGILRLNDDQEPAYSNSTDDVQIDAIDMRTQSWNPKVYKLGGIMFKAGYPAIIRKVMMKNGELDDVKLREKYAEVKALYANQKQKNDEKYEAREVVRKREQELRAKFSDVNFRSFELVGNQIHVGFEAFVTLEELTELIENMRADNSPLIK
jgi:hypothetical protein